jgi:hypothetical protein
LFALISYIQLKYLQEVCIPSHNLKCTIHLELLSLGETTNLRKYGRKGSNRAFFQVPRPRAPRNVDTNELTLHFLSIKSLGSISVRIVFCDLMFCLKKGFGNLHHFLLWHSIPSVDVPQFYHLWLIGEYVGSFIAE